MQTKPVHERQPFHPALAKLLTQPECSSSKCIPAKGEKAPTFPVKFVVRPEAEGVTVVRREVTFARRMAVS